MTTIWLPKFVAALRREHGPCQDTVVNEWDLPTEGEMAARLEYRELRGAGA